MFFVVAAGFCFLGIPSTRARFFDDRTIEKRQKDFIESSAVILGFAALAGLVAGLIAYSTGLSASDDTVHGSGGPDDNPPQDKDES